MKYIYLFLTWFIALVLAEIECDICKKTVQLVNNDIQDNRTEEEIINSLEKVCSLFPQRDKTKCNSFEEQYTNELIHILIEESDPALACTLLNLCIP